MNAEDYAALEHRVMTGELPHCDHTGENSLVINMGSPELDYLQKSYEAGDTITFSQAGNNLQGNLTYVVSAVVFDKNSASSFILPAAEMERAVPYNANSAFIIQTGDSGYIGIEDKLQSLTGASDSLLAYDNAVQKCFQHNFCCGICSVSRHYHVQHHQSGQYQHDQYHFQKEGDGALSGHWTGQ